MNTRGISAIYKFEMHRFARTLWTGLVVPVITTSLYFIVFGSAIGRHIDGGFSGAASYGAFIVPGLMMLSLFNECIFNASFGIHMPRFTGTIYEILSAPLSPLETVIGYVGAAASKAIIVALVILATANLFVDVQIEHPILMILYLLLIATTFCLFGFIIGVWAKGFEQLQIIPLLVVTPLTFLGGAFYSLRDLPEPWQTITHFNPVVYLINGFRWTFVGTSDVPVGISVAITAALMVACMGVIALIFRTGYRLKP